MCPCARDAGGRDKKNAGRYCRDSTLPMFQSLRSALNEVAQVNIPRMSETRDTSHALRSALNAEAERNIKYMSVTLETSQALRSALNVCA